MITLSELLKIEEKQELVRSNIIDILRRRGEWGAHGLYRSIGLEIGVSPAYVARALTGKNRITNTLVLKLSGYFRVPAQWICGEMEGRSYEEVKAAFEKGFGLGPEVVKLKGDAQAANKDGNNLTQGLMHQAKLMHEMLSQTIGEAGLEKAGFTEVAAKEFVEEIKKVLDDSSLTAEEQVDRIRASLKPIMYGLEKAVKEFTRE